MNAKTTNEGTSKSADITHFKPQNWLPWQHPLSNLEKRVKSVIYDQIHTIR